MRGSSALFATVVLNAAGGLLFWIIAARLHAEEIIGSASGLLQWVFLLSLLSSLGLPVAVGRLATGSSERSSRLFHAALAFAAAGSILSATVFMVIARGDTLAPLDRTSGPGAWALLVALIIGGSFSVIADMRLMGLRRWNMVVARAAAVFVLRMVLVPLDVIDNTALWLFVIAAAAPAITGFVAAIGLVWVEPARGVRVPEGLGEFFSFATMNWVVIMCTQGLIFALPAIVSLHLTEAEFAAFYIAWSIAAIITLLPQMISQVLLTEESRQRVEDPANVALALLMALSIAALATAVTTFGRGMLSVLYGEAYASAESILPFLAAGAIPWSITTTALTVLRVRRHDRAVLLLGLLYALVTAPLTYVLAERLGTDGATRAWVIGHLVTAVVAARPLAGVVRLVLRTDDDPPARDREAAAPAASPRRG